MCSSLLNPFSVGIVIIAVIALVVSAQELLICNPTDHYNYKGIFLRDQSIVMVCPNLSSTAVIPPVLIIPAGTNV